MLNLNDLFLDFNDNLTLKKKYKDLVITGRNALRNKIGSKFEAVSYTHLTLPTIA